MTARANERLIANWLTLCCLVILGMILLGGVTRLTHSGLSMVEWRPLLGIIPPLTEAEWMRVFNEYKLSPEYQLINFGMDLDGFKSIFLYEYLHRVLGRLIGLLYFLPLAYFWIKGRIPSDVKGRLVVFLILGGCQGLLGWYMVKSGLVEDPRVSQYRLAAHLGLAIFLYCCLVWLAFELHARARGVQKHIQTAVSPYALGLVALVFIMALSGALVAGTRAGFAYSTWPLMGNSFIPEGLYSITPWWRSIFEDITTVQFNHRMFAYLLVVIVGLFSFHLWRRALKLPAILVMTALSAQVVLGISALIMHVPVSIGAAHQVGAAILLTTLIFAERSLVWSAGRA
ncbi:MAG: COX15/CtaA family protein [Halieaceae bacterium]|nr:COX15/CtaA family protein [Halieaceae bacterium]